jgi:hypothetical protein
MPRRHVIPLERPIPGLVTIRGPGLRLKRIGDAPPEGVGPTGSRRRRPFCLAATRGACPRASSAPCSARRAIGNGSCRVPANFGIGGREQRVRVLRHCAAALAVLAMDFASGHGKTPSMPGYQLNGWLRGHATTFTEPPFGGPAEGNHRQRRIIEHSRSDSVRFRKFGAKSIGYD